MIKRNLLKYKGKAQVRAAMCMMTAMAAVFAGDICTPDTVMANEGGYWVIEDGSRYCWYENGEKQGVKYKADGTVDESYRGREIYDPSSDAWYWLDNIQNGAKAVSKDVYQESEAGDWGEVQESDGRKSGKWVRYDENGHMVKGWQITDTGIYYFDTVYGTMAKDEVVIDGVVCNFNRVTGVLESGGPVDDDGILLFADGWHNIDGVSYWYENGKRQGVRYNADGTVDESYRGKEIYDPSSDAWYWLDNIQNGAKAVSKDVYQESEAGDWGEVQGSDGKKSGKWVRYDENGHMVKGWQTTDMGTYYFEPVYGTMAKGIVTIDEKTYYFNSASGVQAKDTTVEVNGTTYTIDKDGNVVSAEKKNENLVVRKTYGEGDHVFSIYEDEYDENGNRIKRCEYDAASGEVEYRFEWQYDEHGNIIKDAKYNKNGSIMECIEYEYEYDNNGNITKEVSFCGTENIGSIEYEYDKNGNITKEVSFNRKGDISRYIEYEYDNNGNKTKAVTCGKDGNILSSSEYDKNGNKTKEVTYKRDGSGSISYYTEYEYDNNGNKTKTKEVHYEGTGDISYWERREYEYEYDTFGRLTKDTEHLYYYQVQNEVQYERISWTIYEYC